MTLLLCFLAGAVTHWAWDRWRIQREIERFTGRGRR